MTAPDHLFVAMWPITDETRRTCDLVSEAGREMRRLATMQRAQLIGRPKWVRRFGQDVPGSGGAHEVLICTVPAQRLPVDVDAVTGEQVFVGRRTRSAALAGKRTVRRQVAA